ncbi:hypothetical protein HDV00_004901 [Rhizophlyctis rosea]|nr:hypothetical protein HDV00_004901 [Rhizophlyctis rosea]
MFIIDGIKSIFSALRNILSSLYNLGTGLFCRTSPLASPKSTEISTALPMQSSPPTRPKRPDQSTILRWHLERIMQDCKTFLKQHQEWFTSIEYPLLDNSIHTRYHRHAQHTSRYSLRYAFHGTPHVNIYRIFSEGFKIGGREVPMANGAQHGTGVYLAENPHSAICSSGKLIVAAVALDQTEVRHGGMWGMTVVKSKERVLPIAVAHLKAGMYYY